MATRNATSITKHDLQPPSEQSGRLSYESEAKFEALAQKNDADLAAFLEGWDISAEDIREFARLRRSATCRAEFGRKWNQTPALETFPDFIGQKEILSWRDDPATPGEREAEDAARCREHIDLGLSTVAVAIWTLLEGAQKPDADLQSQMAASFFAEEFGLRYSEGLKAFAARSNEIEPQLRFFNPVENGA